MSHDTYAKCLMSHTDVHSTTYVDDAEYIMAQSEL